MGLGKHTGDGRVARERAGEARSILVRPIRPMLLTCKPEMSAHLSFAMALQGRRMSCDYDSDGSMVSLLCSEGEDDVDGHDHDHAGNFQSGDSRVHLPLLAPARPPRPARPQPARRRARARGLAEQVWRRSRRRLLRLLLDAPEVPRGGQRARLSG
eukprot:scaffold2727_cov140-Isochrysis_galbana.AAC.7